VGREGRAEGRAGAGRRGGRGALPVHHRQGRGGVRPARHPREQRRVPDDHETLEEIPDEEWDRTLAINITAFFHLTKAALPHMQPGASIIGTSSVNSDMPPPALLPYNVTKAGIANMVGSLAQMLASRGIRANSVAPGPIWTPLIPATMPEQQVQSFGQEVPLARAGQPAELAPVYVMLASDEASYVSGARIAVTGGKPIL
jgi:NAD(P)-dependent dehydrogenase (short-subunit alcohol dehydrogenase family)